MDTLFGQPIVVDADHDWPDLSKIKFEPVAKIPIAIEETKCDSCHGAGHHVPVFEPDTKWLCRRCNGAGHLYRVTRK